jgi:Integral membrane protein, interacts with FtsH
MRFCYTGAVKTAGPAGKEIKMSWNAPSYVPADIRDVRVTAFLSKVYGWMFLGLLLTAGIALAVASSPALIETLISNRFVLWMMILGQFGLVIYLSVRVEKMAPVTAAALFLLYSATVGVTTSIIFLVYTSASIVSAFVIAGGMFGAMAVFGTLTKRSLAGVGQFMFMGLIGIIIASIVNIFVFSDMLSFVISVIGVLVFTGLTAWDAQRLKHMAVALPDGRVGTYAVVGALSLYLDFINLFFFVLRLLGGRRN